ncbi:MAG: hypothetical protein QG587_1968, partial [Chloroflexota bacterium]|nr:hypothetical protein [Chloroflexota bacterium]
TAEPDPLDRDERVRTDPLLVRQLWEAPGLCTGGDRGG